VAERKRTNRGKDWPFITALGPKLLRDDDPSGCLHIFDAETLRNAVVIHPPSAWMQDARPTLRAALEKDSQLGPALHAEQVFWHQLDACRIRLYEKALRPYVSAVRKAFARREMPLAESHAIRLECTKRHLLTSPVLSYGLEQLVDDARVETARLVHSGLMGWLPNARGHFIGIQ